MIATKISLAAGVVLSIFALYYFFISIRLTSLYKDFAVKQNLIVNNWPLIIYLFFALLCFSFWAFLKNKEKQQITVGYGLVLSLALLVIPFTVMYIGAIYANTHLKNSFNDALTEINRVTITPHPIIKVDNSWETYTNKTYQFQVNYPKSFQLTENNKLENYYDNLVEISDKNTTLNLRAIANINIYQNAPITTVAQREVSDSGFQHETTETLINDYSVALTNLRSQAGTLNVIATIAHPSKNLFIEITCKGNCQNFHQNLSTFKYSD